MRLGMLTHGYSQVRRVGARLTKQEFSARQKQLPSIKDICIVHEVSQVSPAAVLDVPMYQSLMRQKFNFTLNENEWKYRTSQTPTQLVRWLREGFFETG